MSRNSTTSDPLAGIVVALIGLVWTLQVLDVMGGSAMSGKTIFAVIGPNRWALGRAT